MNATRRVFIVLSGIGFFLLNGASICAADVDVQLRAAVITGKRSDIEALVAEKGSWVVVGALCLMHDAVMAKNNGNRLEIVSYLCQIARSYYMSNPQAPTEQEIEQFSDWTASQGVRGETALHLAAWDTNLDVFKVLLRSGFEYDLLTSCGDRAIDLVQGERKREVDKAIADVVPGYERETSDEPEEDESEGIVGAAAAAA